MRVFVASDDTPPPADGGPLLDYVRVVTREKGPVRFVRPGSPETQGARFETRCRLSEVEARQCNEEAMRGWWRAKFQES
jgi:hypothetical protein